MACTKETVKKNGLNIWWMGSKDESTPNVDIVAVQGLGSHPFYTWVGRGLSGTEPELSKSQQFWRRIHKGKQKDGDAGSNNSEIMWLRDLLPEKFPNARIATYSYESGWKKGEKTNLRRCGDQLLEILLQHRQSPQEQRRPTVLIGHSLGGLVIEQALVAAVHRHDCLDLRQAVAGIIFLGVPFDGSNPAQYGEWMAKAVGGDDHLLQELRRNSEQLFNLSIDFWHSYQTWDITCYYENEESTYGPLKIQTVQKQSAAIRGKRTIYMQTDHSGLNKFIGNHDENFALLLPEIERIVRDGPKIVLDRYHGITTTHVLPVWMVPFERNQQFVSRKDQFIQLEDHLFSKGHFTKFALIGLGGIGKTQIALELAYRVRDQTPNVSVFWFSAISVESIEQTFIEIGNQLKVPGISEKDADVKELVRSYLSHENSGPWLIIFDNADDCDVLFQRDEAKKSSRLIDYLPKNNKGCVVLTTRTREVANKFASTDIINIGEMEGEVATQLLQKLLINQEIISDHQNTQELLQELTFLPLAIAQAASYINIHSTSVLDYLSLLQDTEENVVEVLSEDFEDEWRDYKHQKNPIATAWLVSFKQIQIRDSLAADYLWLMSCLSPKDIPRSILPSAPSKNAELKAIGTLKSYSFISQRNDIDAFDIHRLVHLATRSWMRRERLLLKFTESAVSKLAHSLPNSDYTDRKAWRALLSHAAYVLQSPLVDRESQLRLQLIQRFGNCLKEDGRFNEAEEQFQQVMEINSRVLGQEHPDTLTSMNDMVDTYCSQGRWIEAEELGAQVLETRKKVLGQEHPNTLTSMTILSYTYRKQGRWSDAEELGVQALETRKRVLGQEHLDTLASMNDLAMTYLVQGRLKEAEELFQKVVKELGRVFSEEYPKSLSAVSNLALAYQDEGRWGEAEELQTKVLEIRKRVLGQEHPGTLTNMGNLALTYWNQGRWKEAEELGVRVLEARKRVSGQEHPDTLTSMSNLALTYWNQGRWKESEELQVQVLETRKKLLGQEHPDTLTEMNNLALAYRDQERWKDSAELQVQVLEIGKRKFGEEHPLMLTTMSNLMLTYGGQERWKEAEELGVQVLETRTRVLGQEHPDTLTSMMNLTAAYWNQERWKEAEELGMQVLETGKRVLGQEHPFTLTAMSNLASTYGKQKMWNQAEELGVQALVMRKEVLGQEHKDTLYSMSCLAVTYSDQERWKEAEELETQVVEIRKRVFGQGHPTTLSSMRNLAATWRSQGRDSDALALMSEIVQGSTEGFGASHPTTKRYAAKLEGWMQIHKSSIPSDPSASAQLGERTK